MTIWPGGRRGISALYAGRSAGRDSGGVPVMVDGAGELSGGCGKPPDLALLRTVQYSHRGRVFPVREGQGRIVTASSGNTHWRFKKGTALTVPCSGCPERPRRSKNTFQVRKNNFAETECVSFSIIHNSSKKSTAFL